MSPGGAPSTALVITASVTAALVTAALGEALRRLCAVPPPREDPRPSTEELIALVLAVQAKADRAERAAPAAKRALDLGGDVAGSRETSPRGLRSDSARDSRDSQDSPHSRFRNANAHSPGQVRKLSASSGAPSQQRDESRGMQRSSSVGSQLQEHDQQPARHTEDAVLRQMNLHLMGRGHAKSARDAVSMYSSVPGNLTPNKTKVVRVALTGGPCAGKTSAHS